MGPHLYPAPDRPGWHEWRVGAPEQFNRKVMGRLIARLDNEQTARVRMIPQRMHSNLNDVVHGGAILSFIDIAMFCGANLLSTSDTVNGVTVDLQTQFITPGDVARPLDALVELTKETRRMAFVRGLVVQEDDAVASFTGLLRKLN